ncbi:MAG: hypothetical protein ACK5MP_09445 [Nostocoides sp.]
MSATDLNTPRIWAEFDDPDQDGQRFRVDLTWLTSNWTCLFGAGCPGIYADRPDDGCCTLGAHFTGKEDLRRVHMVVKELGKDEWQFYPGSSKKSVWSEPDPEPATDPAQAPAPADVRTKTVRGACIFLNRPGFPAGSGCALHQHAVAEGRAPWTAKPDVCWQLPIRRSYSTVTRPDGTSYLEITIGEYDRRGWGPGGHDLDWFCSNDTEAHVGREPVFRSMRAELIELMGAGAYADLVVRCEAHIHLTRSARRSVARNELLPLLVHPATLASGKPGRSKAPRKRRS